MNFYKIKVKAIHSLTAQSAQIDFDIPEELKPDFQFIAGQYITLDFDGERRDYSICTSPLNLEISIAVKATKGGKYSNFLVHDLKVGDYLNISNPNGKFTIPSKPNEKRTLLAFVAGSGITPVMSILEYSLQTEYWLTFHLFFANKSNLDIMFLEKIAQLKEKFPNNFFPHFFYTEEPQTNFIYEGRLTAKKFQLIINQLIDINETDEVLICGPEEMIFDLTAEIFKTGIPKKHIHFELFNPTVDPEKLFPQEVALVDKVNVKVHLDGDISTFIWHKDTNLIDAMLDEGLDAPYSCKGGVCSSCMCKVIEGEVQLGNNFVLTDSDINNKLILACISRPLTENLEIDFDSI